MINRAAVRAAVKATALMLVACVVLAVIFTAAGYGPWDRWLAPSLLVAFGTLVLNLWRGSRLTRHEAK